MKIVFIISGLNAGGAENMLLRLLEKIDKTTFSCNVISLTNIGEVGQRITKLGIPVEAFNLRLGWSSLFAFFRLVKRLRQIKPDIVHTWMYHADLIGGFAAKIVRMPAIIWCVRSSDFVNSGTKFTTKFVLRLCAAVSSWMPNVVLYNSNRGLNYHKKLNYRESCQAVIPNGVDVGQFKPDELARLEVRSELGISSTTPLIGLIGRYDPLKNHAGFIRAAQELHEMMPEVHFLMAGKDVDRSNLVLNAMIVKSGLKNCCHLLGSRVDIPRITAALDVATSASWSEAFPNILIEAMACGVPCVATDAGDSALILGDLGGIVQIGDVPGLVKQWMKFLCLNLNERHRYAVHARNRVIDEFDVVISVKRYMYVYRKVIEAQIQNRYPKGQLFNGKGLDD